jgi:hypothetical protein
MPKRIELSPHATTEELENLYRKAKDPVERSHLQIVWLLSEGTRTEEVSEVTGYSPGWVRKIARRYNEWGVDALGDRSSSFQSGCQAEGSLGRVRRRGVA